MTDTKSVYRLYEIVPCNQCSGKGSIRPSDISIYDHPAYTYSIRYQCPRCEGEGTLTVKTDIIVEGPATAWETFTASDGYPAIRGRGEGYYPITLDRKTRKGY